MKACLTSVFTFLYFLAFGTGILMCTPERQCLGDYVVDCWVPEWGRTSPSHPSLQTWPNLKYFLPPWSLSFLAKWLGSPLPIFYSQTFEEMVVLNSLSSMRPGGLEVFIYCHIGMKEATWQCWAGSWNLLEVILMREITENDWMFMASCSMGSEA